MHWPYFITNKLLELEYVLKLFGKVSKKESSSGVEIQVDFRIEPGQESLSVTAGLTFFAN